MVSGYVRRAARQVDDRKCEVRRRGLARNILLGITFVEMALNAMRSHVIKKKK